MVSGCVVGLPLHWVQEQLNRSHRHMQALPVIQLPLCAAGTTADEGRGAHFLMRQQGRVCWSLHHHVDALMGSLVQGVRQGGCQGEQSAKLASLRVCEVLCKASWQCG